MRLPKNCPSLSYEVYIRATKLSSNTLVPYLLQRKNKYQIYINIDFYLIMMNTTTLLATSEPAYHN